MLAGNVMNGTIGKQMVDTLVESAGNVEVSFKFFFFQDCNRIYYRLNKHINFPNKNYAFKILER